MAILTFLGDLGVTHLFTFNNTGTSLDDDHGNSVAPTKIIGGDYSFDTNPICEGFTHSLKTNTENTQKNGAIIDNRNDINGGGGSEDASLFDYVADKRTIHLWFKSSSVDTPTCIYEQGGTSNNFALITGIAKTITWQAAESGQPFLIAQSNFLTKANRSYFATGIWEHDSQVVTNGNRLSLYVNGILQDIVQNANATNAFPGHAGDIAVGNSNDDLQTYNGSNFKLAAREKHINLLGMYNNIGLSSAQMREIFERTVIPVATIQAGTVENQQIALDALSSTVYENANCAIRIFQATDETDYRLFIDDIKFVQDNNLRDIAVQYVGENVLTLENANGSNVVEVSTPAEVDMGAEIIEGGGTIALKSGTVRVGSDSFAQSNITATKIVLTQAGTYQFNNVIVDEIENVSDGEVIIFTNNPIDLVTETHGTISIKKEGSLILTGVKDSSVYLRSSDSTTTYFDADFSGEYSKTITKDGQKKDKWIWVVSRPGYEKITGSIKAGNDVTEDITYTRKIDLGTGLPAYNEVFSNNISFTSTPTKLFADFIGDITAPFFFDGLEKFLATEDGCAWIAKNRRALVIRVSTDFAGQILILPEKLTFQSTTSGSKRLSAFVISTQNAIDRSVFGSVVFNKAESSTEVSNAVWEYLDSADTVSGSMKEVVDKAKSHAFAANLQTQQIE